MSLKIFSSEELVKVYQASKQPKSCLKSVLLESLKTHQHAFLPAEPGEDKKKFINRQRTLLYGARKEGFPNLKLRSSENGVLFITEELDKKLEQGTQTK